MDMFVTPSSQKMWMDEQLGCDITLVTPASYDRGNSKLRKRDSVDLQNPSDAPSSNVSKPYNNNNFSSTINGNC